MKSNTGAQDTSDHHDFSRDESLLSAIIEGSNDAIVSKNLNGIINSWNPGAEEMFGYSAEEAIGRPVTMLMTPDRRHEEDYILERLRRGEKIEDFETIRRHKNGTLLNVSVTISPVYNASGEIIGASKIARDITRRKQVEQQLQELNETLEERVAERTQSLMAYQNQLRSLATRLSEAEEQERHRLAEELHDNLGQMLAVSKMKADMMANLNIEGEAASDLEDIRQGLKDAIAFTRDLMSELKPPSDLNKEDVTAILEWLGERMQKHDLEVLVEDDGEPKKVTTQVGSILLQSVRELLFNVIKHTDENQAKVRIKRREGQVEITVSDRGPGIEQTQEEESSISGGFGLKNISERLELIGGGALFDSQAGEGTVVTLSAPLKNSAELVAKEPMPEREEEPPAAESGERSIKVMLVDDHRLMRQGLKEMLEKKEGITVVGEAANGKEAIKEASEVRPDIVIMDLYMPDMDGIRATREVRENLPEARIIGLSIRQNKRMVEKLYEAGANAFLTKEEAFETLEATLLSEASHLPEE